MKKVQTAAEVYDEYMRKVGDRTELFDLLRKKLAIKSAIYPGSHVDITPSLFFRRTVYIDNFKGARKFFSKPDVMDLIATRKMYEEEPLLSYYFEDYREIISEIEKDHDLLISLYAGFVSKYCKCYVKKKGLLLVNDSHGDATMANLDSDFSLFGVIYRSNRKLYFTQRNLDRYFIPKKEREITKDIIEETMKGIAYINTTAYYIFRRIN